MKNSEKVLREEIKKILQESYNESDMLVDDDDMSAEGAMAPMSLEEISDRLKRVEEQQQRLIAQLMGQGLI